MKERTYGIILGIINMVLLVVCGVFFLGKDKSAPKIILPGSSVVYAAETGEEELLEGVTAFDEKDGELTDYVVIEKIVTDADKATATIIYGVADSSGNVGKVTCTVDMIVEENAGIPQEGSGLGESVTENGSEEKEGTGRAEDSKGAEDTEVRDGREEAGNVGTEDTENREDGENTEEKGEGTREVDANSEDADSERDANGSEDIDDEPSSDRDPEETDANGEDIESNENAEEQEALPTAGEARNTAQTVSSRPDTGRPSMVLKSQEVKVKAGSGPAWVNVIEGLHDDKDNYETLLKSLKINGTYDKDKAGTYNVTLTVTDGEGNESNAYPMKIIVEAWEQTPGT